MEFELKHTFPTLIGYYNDSSFVSKVLPVANHLLKMNTKKWGYNSTFGNPQAMDYIDENPFINKYILELGYKFLNQLGYRTKHPLKSQVFFSNMKPNDYHPSHNHPHSILSGVIYLKTSPNISPITFQEPRTIKFFNNLIPLEPQNQINSTSITYYPKDNDILIWESWLNHSVSSNKGEYRKTLVFNLNS
jgi:uncharacterized protein (TIGR02466 family)